MASTVETTEAPAPALVEANIKTLHPTQLAVGMQQVREKAARIGEKKKKKQKKYFEEHEVPVVVGPGGKHYLVDHHHLCVAALQINVHKVYIQVIEDWSADSPQEFWQKMHPKYVWLHDATGKPLTLEEFPSLLPEDVTGLKDDPYRSLAAIVRKAGGFNKDWMPFAEFHWANFFREHIPLADGSTITDADIGRAMQHSRIPTAAHLPGFIQ
jgi:hypothetical protein